MGSIQETQHEEGAGTKMFRKRGGRRRGGLALAVSVGVGIVLGAGVGVLAGNLPVGVSFGLAMGAGVAVFQGLGDGESVER